MAGHVSQVPLVQVARLVLGGGAMSDDLVSRIGNAKSKVIGSVAKQRRAPSAQEPSPVDPHL